MSDSILVQMADAVLQHIDKVEIDGRKSNPVIVFSREGRMKARADSRFFEFCDHLSQIEDIPFMGYPTRVDPNQSDDYIVREIQ